MITNVSPKPAITIPPDTVGSIPSAAIMIE